VILGGAVLMALLTFLVVVLIARLAPSYQSTASILISSPQISIQFDPKVTTQSSTPDLNSPAASLTRRMDTLMSLARSREVAELAANDLRLEPNWRGVTGRQLLTRNPIQARARGELLDVTATASSPEEAQTLASAWAKALVARASALFAPDSQARKNLEVSYDEVRQAYDKATADIAENERTSKRNEIVGRITEQDQALKMLRARDAQLSSILAEARLLRARADVQGPTSPAIRDGFLGLLTRLHNYDAAVGASAAGSIAAGANAPGGNATQPPGILIQAEPRATIDGDMNVVPMLEDLISLLAAQLDSSSGDTGSVAGVPKGISQQILDAEANLRALRSQNEMESAEFEKLVANRDALKASLQSVNNKLAESQLAASIGQGEVAVAVDGSIPETDVVRRLLLPPALIGIAVFLILCGFVLARQAVSDSLVVRHRAVQPSSPSPRP
jgi:hypothetical protein